MLSRSDGSPDWLNASWERPQEKLAPLIGTTGYRLPEINVPWRPLEAGTLAPNIFVHGAVPGQNNWLIAPPDFKPPAPLHIHIRATAKQNLIIIGTKSNIYGEIHIYNDGGTIVVGDDIWQPSAIYLRMWTGYQLLFWGAGSTTNGLHIQIQGEQKDVIVGEDCMFSSGIYIRNSDMHAIFDIKTGLQTNFPGNVRLEPHVWIGQDSLILKDTCIGFGSIIGAKSVVSRDIPDFSLAAGSPAKVLKSDTSWDREGYVQPEKLQKLISLSEQIRAEKKKSLNP